MTTTIFPLLLKEEDEISLLLMWVFFFLMQWTFKKEIKASVRRPAAFCLFFLSLRLPMTDDSASHTTREKLTFQAFISNNESDHRILMCLFCGYRACPDSFIAIASDNAV